ncbi:unnamed protein product, partial [Ectocarpus sp. 12 AP-2014]
CLRPFPPSLLYKERPQVVGMDGGHLKGEWNGMMLTLTCKHANNENIHVATVI